MSGAIQLFNFKGTRVRVIECDGETLFGAKDVAELLGYANTTHAIRTHCKGARELRSPTSGGIQVVKFIPEADVYRLIVRSRLPEAQEFERWLFETVLPALRKDGMYVVGEEKLATGEMTEDELTLLVITRLQAKNERLQLERDAATAQVVVMEPKAALVDQHYAHHDFMPLTKFARSLDGVSSPSIKRDLLRHGYLWKPSKDTYRARSQYRDKLFREKFNEFSGKMDLKLGLPRLRGHPEALNPRCPHAQDPFTLRAGVPAPDDRVGSRRT